jgi:3-(3-hydroxy-phenyl)propionate hydroxylase
MHRRWEISLNEGEDPLEAATAKRTWELLAPWITPDDAQLWRQASYRFHALVAKEWRRERVFIAGDAAHQQPPFLGQGMCQGIRDAVNLSWRLNAVLRQGAPTRLLDSYASERAAHVRELTQRIKHIGKIITERDLDKARARDTKLLEECDGVVRPTPRQDVQPALSAGLLSSQIHPARGTLFPQPMVLNSQGQRVRMDEVYVPGWRIVLSQQASAKMIQIAQTGSASKWPVLTLGTPALTEVDAVLQTWFQTHSVCAAIVRPDHYVFGVSNDISELQTQLSELIPSVVPLFENTQENP